MQDLLRYYLSVCVCIVIYLCHEEGYNSASVAVLLRLLLRLQFYYVIII